MYMKDRIAILDDFLRISRKDILTHADRISAQLAKAKADSEYDKSKIVEGCLVLVLGGEACVGQVAVDVAPFAQAAVVEHFEFVCNDKRNNAAIEALLEHDKAPHAAIAVLKRMDAFKAYMQVKDVLKSVMACMVVIKQSFHVLGNVLWRAGLFAADFI